VKKLLIIEDDEIFAAGLIRALSRRGFACQMATTTNIAREICDEFKPEYILLDLNLGDENSQNYISLLKNICPGSTLVVLTGYGTIPSAVAAIKDGADAYLTKPATPDSIEKTLNEKKPQNNAASLWDLENEHIIKVLGECGGNISQAAIKLGLHRRTLQRRLKKI